MEGLSVLKQRLVRAMRAGLEPAPVPPPYDRMLALSSDVEFTTWAAQLDMLRTLYGLGLETSFSHWLFRGPPPTWHIFSDDLRWTPQGRAALPLLRAGALDTHHAFGGRGQGAPVNRRTISLALETLDHEGVRCPVFTNHGSRVEVQNVGGEWSAGHAFADYGQGDAPGAEVYHLDRTVAHGARYFWTDIDLTESCFLPPSGPQGLLATQVGRDGTPILRFRRTAAGGDPFLSGLAGQVRNALASPQRGLGVLYTHMGVVSGQRPLRPAQVPVFPGWPAAAAEPRHGVAQHGGADTGIAPGKGKNGTSRTCDAQGPETLEALRELALAQSRGEVLVTSLSRLLGFALLMASRPWTIRCFGPVLTVAFDAHMTYGDVRAPLDWQGLEGWAVPLGPRRAACAVLGGQVRFMDIFEAGGVRWAGFPWRRRMHERALEESFAARAE